MRKTKSSEHPLLSRGIDSELARSLIMDGWTVTRLKGLGDLALMKLGLNEEVINSLQKMPPIPKKVLVGVLSASRWVCCICKQPQRSIVVHHIESWDKSRDHSAGNLVVLCLQHHHEALSSRAFDLSVSQEYLLEAKKEWESVDAEIDWISNDQQSQVRKLNWWYFDPVRLFELFRFDGELTTLSRFPEAQRIGICDPQGRPYFSAGLPSPYHGTPGLCLYAYLSEVMLHLVVHTQVNDITHTLAQQIEAGLLYEGHVIYLHAQHKFSDVEPERSGEETVQCVCRVDGGTICFTFNRAQATSSLARSIWLRGSRSLGTIAKVDRVERIRARYKINCTVLAIRSAE